MAPHKLSLFVLLLFSAVWLSKAHSQTNCSYIVVTTGGYTMLQIDQAFGNANLDSYRKKNVRRSMVFVNGAEVELYSATEMQNMHCLVNGSLAMDDSEPLDPNRRFELHPSGVIFESVQAVYKR